MVDHVAATARGELKAIQREAALDRKFKDSSRHEDLARLGLVAAAVRAPSVIQPMQLAHYAAGPIYIQLRTYRCAIILLRHDFSALA